MRIALILPQHRLGLWHEQLAQRLGAKHSIFPFIDDTVPRYPRTLLAWLSVERLIYRQQHLPSAAFMKSLQNRTDEINDGAFDVVVDLSERAQPRPGSLSVHYDGSTDSLALIDRLLGRQTPHLTVSQSDDSRVLVQSLPEIDDKLRLTRGLQICFARGTALIEQSLSRQQPVERIAEDLAARQPPSSNLTSYIGRFVGAKATAKLLNRFFPPDRWQIALRNNGGSFVAVVDDGKRYYADPFLFRYQGQTFVLLEDYCRAIRKGVISAAEVVGDRLASNPVPVLERPYHLSYPVVLEEAGTIYMLPESSANKTVELYRAVAFPWQWEREKILIQGVALADATPVFHQNRWWLFAAAGDPGTTGQDELVIFYSDRLTGPWQPHARNPVKSDCRSARPAGRIVCEHGRLFRPAQNCEERYGSGIVWQEIIELTPSRFYEKEVARFDASSIPGLKGLHTVNQSGSLQVIDINPGRAFAGLAHLAGDSMPRLARDLDVTFSRALPHWRNPAADHPAAAASRHSFTSRVA